ncbi:MAG: polysaccharide deacetylase family protein [Elusimicrobia bacterium]|nr:polysaccharide deacetylase family protein [Elusimicrobiota bacterium]
MMETLAAAGAAAAVLSARWNWWRPRVKGLPVLMYHKVGDYPAGSKLKSLWVSAEAFRKQLEYLKRRGYTPLLFSEWRAAELGQKPLPERPVMITFDDGYANNHAVAFPLLKEFGMKANIFLVHETLDTHNSWHDPESEPWIPMLSTSMLGEMQDSGLVEFGSHTMRHRNLTALSLEEVSWELKESKKRLEQKLGREMLGFAYPYGAGAYHPEIRRLARKAGYRYDFGIKQGIAPLPWDPESGPIKRLFVRGDDYMLDFHLNMTRGRARF